MAVEERGAVQVGDRRLVLTNLDKELYPAEPFSKGEVNSQLLQPDRAPALPWRSSSCEGAFWAVAAYYGVLLDVARWTWRRFIV